MITLKLKDNDILLACAITDLIAELDEQNKGVKLYSKAKDTFLGYYEAVYGIEEDDFMEQVSKKEIV